MDDIKQRAIQARVMLQQPFWQEIAAFASDLESQALIRLKDAKHADPLILKGFHQQWITIHETVDKILRYPRAVIEDASQSSVDYGPDSDKNNVQGEQWQ